MDIDRMNFSLSQKSIEMPEGLSRQEMRNFILSHSNDSIKRALIIGTATLADKNRTHELVCGPYRDFEKEREQKRAFEEFQEELKRLSDSIINHGVMP